MTPAGEREIVAAAFPFVPADLSIAHFASTYLPADVHCRFRRVLGHAAELICGIDVHSIQASIDGRTRNGMAPSVARYEAEYRRQMKGLDVELSVFERTDHPAHLRAVQDTLSRLRDADLVRERSRDVWRCLGCSGFPPLRMTLVTDVEVRATTTPERCPFCSRTSFERVSRPHLYLRLDARRERLRELSAIVNPPVARPWISRILEAPLTDWNFSRDNQVGVPIDGRENQSLYLWFESLLGYVSMAGILGEGQQPTIQFHGKNIVWHHSILWPVLLEAGMCGDATLTRNSIRGFLDVRSSSPELVDFDAALQRFPVDYLRYYLVQCVPFGFADFRVDLGEMRRVCNTQLCNQLGNYLRRATFALRRLPRSRGRLSAESTLWRRFHEEVIPAVEQTGEFGDVRSAARVVTEYGRSLNRMIHEERLYQPSAPDATAKLTFGVASLLTLLRPIVPQLAREANPFADWTPSTIADIPAALERPLNDRVAYWQRLDG